LRTIARLARECSELPIVDDQIGAPTSAALIVEALARMIEGGNGELRQQIDAAEGCVHLTAAGETSWYGFAGAIIGGLRMRGARLSVERPFCMLMRRFAQSHSGASDILIDELDAKARRIAKLLAAVIEVSAGLSPARRMMFNIVPYTDNHIIAN